MRIFFVCQRVPFPPDRGDKITTFNEIRHLSKSHEVHVFCLADGARDVDHILRLRDYAKTVTAVPLSAILGKLRAAKALVTGGALSVANFSEKGLHASIKAKCTELKPDLIFVYSCNVAQFVEHFPHIPRIMQFADLDSLKWDQYARRSKVPMRWIYQIESRRLLEYERHIARTFSCSLVCTAAEKRDFERLIPSRPVSIVGNGVDLQFFRSEGRPKKPASIIFTGVMDYFPNVDSVRWFCEKILPIVKERVAEVNFVICGSRPSTGVRRLARLPGVTVTGRVPDVRPYLDVAQLFVAPLRLARGIQNKLLEALAMGLPCVSTTAAWNGTVIQMGEGILAADDPREFADYVVRLLRNPDYRVEMARKARAAVEENYTWQAQMQRLDQFVAAAAGGLPVAGTGVLAGLAGPITCSAAQLIGPTHIA